MILTDPYFENRLKMFDPSLRLIFDQTKRRWTILEKAHDNSGWNCILVAEDSRGEPKPLGEWVFNRLFVYRNNYEAKRDGRVDNWLKRFQYEEELQKQKIQQALADDSEAGIREDISQWRKELSGFLGKPRSDAIAGYRKKEDCYEDV